MKPLRVLTAAEQVATHLREEILRGTWVETMPGTAKLATTLNVGIRTVADALEQLESEGLLVNSGKRKKRLIVVPKNASPPALRVAILLYEAAGRESRLFTGLLLRLIETGCQPIICNKSLTELGMNPAKVRRYVGTVSTDAWIIIAASHDILEWFSKQAAPAFAIGGRYFGKNIAGTGVAHQAVIPDVVERLVTLGHRRIVVISRAERRKPKPAILEQCFLDEMERHGIPIGSYNLPDWTGDGEGLQECLDGLFKVTPPTALLVTGASIFYGVQQYLALRKITTPNDISLICNEYCPEFEWCGTSISHFSWDTKKLYRNVINWVKKVGRGMEDKRQHSVQSSFIEGGTIGPAPAENIQPPGLS